MENNLCSKLFTINCVLYEKNGQKLVLGALDPLERGDALTCTALLTISNCFMMYDKQFPQVSHL